MKTYRTVQGDQWDWIAHQTLGSEYYMEQLMEANPKHIGVAVFPAGIVLTIPELEVPKALNLPPWKR